MSTAKEELHTLVDQLPADKTEGIRLLLGRALDPPPPDRGKPASAEGHDDPIRRHWRQVGDRIGLYVDRLPKNGGWYGGVSGGRVELTKDWESEDARHRLSKIDVQGNEIILLERMTVGEGFELCYEVRVFHRRIGSPRRVERSGSAILTRTAPISPTVPAAVSARTTNSWSPHARSAA